MINTPALDSAAVIQPNVFIAFDIVVRLSFLVYGIVNKKMTLENHIFVIQS